MFNKIILIGRLTHDPELRYTNAGNAVSNFSLAVDRGFKNQQGEKQTDFIDCAAWGKTAENTAQYMRKGSLVCVEGRLQIESYEKDGIRRKKAWVVCENVRFLERKKEG